MGIRGEEMENNRKAQGVEAGGAFLPGYVVLHEAGLLRGRAEALRSILGSCTLCPRRCRVNRLEGETGYCGGGERAGVSSAFPHFGEEPPLVGRGGSGTIFFNRCNLLCRFCQNYDISHLGKGGEVTEEELAELMIYLQGAGCHNVNFVTPTHFASQIAAALPRAAERGLRLPLVWNCGGYESLEVIRLLEGIVDIYMPDVKFMSPQVAEEMAGAPDYPGVVKGVLKEMHRQVGDLRINPMGLAERGLLVRHLVMPNDLGGTGELVHFMSREISRDAYINIMDQYRPCFRAFEDIRINRGITRDEYRRAVEAAREAGLWRGFQ